LPRVRVEERMREEECLRDEGRVLRVVKRAREERCMREVKRPQEEHVLHYIVDIVAKAQLLAQQSVIPEQVLEAIVAKALRLAQQAVVPDCGSLHVLRQLISSVVPEQVLEAGVAHNDENQRERLRPEIIEELRHEFTDALKDETQEYAYILYTYSLCV